METNLKRAIFALCAVLFAATMLPPLTSTPSSAPKSIEKPKQDMPAPPKQAEDKNMDKFVGTWEGTGSAEGMEFKSTETWAWALNHQFLRGDLTMEFKGMPKPMDATFYIKPGKDGKYTLWYFDGMGLAMNSSGTSNEKGRVSEWTEQGMPAKAEMMWNDKGGFTESYFMKKSADAEWTQTGSCTYKKK